MFDPIEIPPIIQSIHQTIARDYHLLEELRQELRGLKSEVRTIKSRSSTAISLVASDGGNNSLVFDPFSIQVVRVVDSYGKQLFFDVVTPITDTDQLSLQQFNSQNQPITALGHLMNDLGVKRLSDLSPMIPSSKKMREHPTEISPSWILVYRDLCEWAVLYERISQHTFATDTLLVRDGLLRSKIFAYDLFLKLRKLIEAAIAENEKKHKRKIFLVGLAKHSKVLDRYNLAMMLENVFPDGQPYFLRVPREMEAKAYVWPEYARGAEVEGSNNEVPKFTAGDLYFVRFGNRSGDPIWSVDILSSQSRFDSEVFGYLLADAINGFPIPFYPLCLQKAHEFSEVVEFDYDIMQQEIIKAIRGNLNDHEKNLMDIMNFKNDVALRRYK